MVKELTAEQNRFSGWASWKDTLLAERLLNGWSLEYWQ